MRNKTKVILLILLSVLLVAEAAFLGIRIMAEPEATAAPTEAPTEASTQTPTEASTETPTEAPTEEPTEAPTEPPVVYRDPLTGEVLEAPLTTRIFGVSINNVPKALPHEGTQTAGMVFEMFINDYATRWLALYTDIRQVEEIGAVRSMRYNFTDLGIAYDAFIAHAGGSNEVIADCNRENLDHLNVDTDSATYYSFRNEKRLSAGYSREHTLFLKGPGLYSKAEKEGYRVTQDENKTYGLNFTENGTPDAGDPAAEIDITFRLDGNTKLTTLTYNEEIGQYIYSQYGKAVPEITDENLDAFENVFIIVTKVTNKGVYHVADLDGSGEGYFACGGVIIPILWHHENPEDPITYTLTNGNPLYQGIGTSYVAVVPTTSTITYE